MASTDRDRAYLMAQGAWRNFRHTGEPEEAFASRIADIAAERGLSAAAEAIAQDCREHGLQMSAHRVLKGLASDLGRGGQPGPHAVPPGILRFGQTNGSDPRWLLFIALALIVGVVLLIAAWNWLF